MWADLRDALQRARNSPASVHRISQNKLRSLRIWPVRGDGKCLWYSLIGARILAEGHCTESLNRLDACGYVTSSAKQLRRRVRKELESDDGESLKLEYAPFWAAGEEGTNNATSAKEYLDGVSQGVVFGGALEILAASKVLARGIVVIDVEQTLDRCACGVAYLTWHGEVRSDTAPAISQRRGSTASEP